MEGETPPPKGGIGIIIQRKEFFKMKRILFLATVSSIIITVSAGHPLYMRITTGILGAALLAAAIVSYKQAKEQ